MITQDLFISLPWTKPFDYALYYGAKIFQYVFYLNLKVALIIWGAIFCAICYGLSLFFIYKNALYLNYKKSAQVFILIAFALMPEIHEWFFPIRVDHHMVLLMLGIAFWGNALKSLCEKSYKHIFYSAIISGLAIWIHIEFLALVAVFELFLFLNWLFDSKKYQKKLLIYNIIVAVFLYFALFIESYDAFTLQSIVYDSLSIVHVSIFIVLVLNAIILFILKFNNIIYKSLLLAVLWTLDLIVFFKLFGIGFFDPYAGLDVYAVNNFFPMISEFQPFFREYNFTIMVYLILFSVITYSIFKDKIYLSYVRIDKHNILNKNLLNNFFLLSLFLICSLLMFKNVRWSYYVYPLLIFLVAPIVSLFLEKLDNKKLLFHFAFSEYLYVFLILYLLTNIGLSYRYFIMLNTPKELRKAHQAYMGCYQDISKYIKKDLVEDFGVNKDMTVMVNSDYGPLVLYSTPYKVLSTNNHRNIKGLKSIKDFYDNKLTEQEVLNLVKNDNIKVFIACKQSSELSSNSSKSSWLIKKNFKKNQYQNIRVFYTDLNKVSKLGEAIKKSA